MQIGVIGDRAQKTLIVHAGKILRGGDSRCHHDRMREVTMRHPTGTTDTPIELRRVGREIFGIEEECLCDRMWMLETKLH